MQHKRNRRMLICFMALTCDEFSRGLFLVLQILVSLIGLSVMAMLAAPTVRLAMMPVYSQKQKNNYSLAESKAILIRKQVVNDVATFADASDSTTKITQANVASSLAAAGLSTVIDGCTIYEKSKGGYTPRLSTMNVPSAVECTVSSGQFQGTAWQPLYTSTNLTESTTAVNPATYTLQDMGKIGPLCAASIVGKKYSTDPTKTSPPATVCGVTITKLNGKFDANKVPYFGISATGEYFLDYSQ